MVICWRNKWMMTWEDIGKNGLVSPNEEQRWTWDAWHSGKWPEIASSRCSISQVLMCLSYLWEIQEARYWSVGISLFLRSSSVFLKMWYWTSNISITLDLLEWQFGVPTPSLMNQKLQGWSQSICVYKPLRQLGSTLKFENHCSRPFQLSPRRKLSNNSL